MDIKNIITLIDNVKPYDKGTHIMWTDEHISKHLLEAHINPNIDMASRTPDKIDKILNWIQKETIGKSKDILDLGCGPGLYTKKLAESGNNVTGVDFSKGSIEYAKNEAKKNNLNIKYICQNYLEIEFEEEFDLIIMIYCDLGVLSSEEREILINKIYRALKPGGHFIFDALNEKAIKKISYDKKWEMSNGGFWSENPYICLSQSLHFQEKKAILDQHVVIDEDSNYKLYRFWNHYFNKEDMKNIFIEAKFKEVEEVNGMLEDGGLYNDEGVTFYKIKK